MMRLLPGSLAIAAALALTGATTAAECYEYGVIGYDDEGGNMFSVSGTVHNTITGGTGTEVLYEVGMIDFETEAGTTAYESWSYAQFRQEIEGDVVWGVDVNIIVDEMTSYNWRIAFGGEYDIFELKPYTQTDGVGAILVGDEMIGIYVHTVLTAVPGAGALPLAGLAGLAVGRRRRRGNK